MLILVHYLLLFCRLEWQLVGAVDEVDTLFGKVGKASLSDGVKINVRVQHGGGAVTQKIDLL